MVVFGIGAQILDALLIKTTVFAADSAFYIATWSVQAFLGTIWTPPLTEEQRLRLEVKQLRIELQRLDASTAEVVDDIVIYGDEYIIV